MADDNEVVARILSAIAGVASQLGDVKESVSGLQAEVAPLSVRLDGYSAQLLELQKDKVSRFEIVAVETRVADALKQQRSYLSDDLIRVETVANNASNDYHELLKRMIDVEKTLSRVPAIDETVRGMLVLKWRILAWGFGATAIGAWASGLLLRRIVFWP